MKRTLISISEKDKEWLERYSHKHKQSLAQTIRVAIHCFKAANGTSMNKSIIRETSGIWKDRKKDGLDYVNDLRNEWDNE